MPDGSEHELRPTDHSPYSGSRDFLRGFYNVIPNGSPMRYHSVDGTFIFARISSMGDWTVYTADGTQISLASGIQRIQDTNGNGIKVFSDANGTHYQDEQTNREIRITYNPAGQGQTQVWYKTVGGTEHHIDINWGTTTVQGKLYSVNKPACEYAGLTQALFFTNRRCSRDRVPANRTGRTRAKVHLQLQLRHKHACNRHRNFLLSRNGRALHAHGFLRFG